MTFDEWKEHAEWDGDHWRKDGLKYMWRDDALRAAWDASRREALEEAATRLEDRARGYITPDDGLADIVEGLEYGASVIRALAAAPKDGES